MAQTNPPPLSFPAKNVNTAESHCNAEPTLTNLPLHRQRDCDPDVLKEEVSATVPVP